jgi:hypothetical protein
MDLRQETLVPLKTLAKTRDGRKAVFINLEENGEFRFCPEGDIGTYRVAFNGIRYQGLENHLDIVSISRQRALVAGDRVEITGLICAPMVGREVASVIVRRLNATLGSAQPNNTGKEIWSFHNQEDGYTYLAERSSIKFISRST